MIRRLAFTLVSILVTWAGGVRLAEASCAGTSIHVSVAPIVWLSDVIPVAWHIDPACAVIETGLLLGRDPAALTPAGQPIYGQRTSYEQDLPVREGGGYVVAAYARDEAGSVVESPPQVVVIDVPPVLPPDTHGSHGPLPFYTGTDADFLQPAGEPHYASLRSATLRNQRFVTDLFSEGFDNRLTASTQPTEVRAEQQPPLEVGGVAFAVPPAEVDRALGDLDTTFRSLGYPRSGLYLVSCGVFARFQPDQRRSGPACGFFISLSPVSLGYGEAAGGGGHASMRSSATYVIPKPPAGKRVQSARLRVFTTVVSDPQTRNFSAIRLSGKSPTTVDTVACFDGNLFSNCFGWVTWDFTAEARALAAQGGGELPLTLDPIPPVIFRFPGLDGSLANYTITPSVNYPWQHDHENGALTLTFETDCPRELKVSVTPDELRPRMPRGQVEAAGLTNIGTTAEVTVTASACPTPGQTPAPVDVTLEVRPPVVSNDGENGGHLHASLNSARRLTGTFLDYYYNGGQTTASCRIETFVEGVGTCTVQYFTRDMSGVETLVATAADYPEAKAQVKVRVPVLEPLPANPSQYVLVGAPSSQDPCPGRSVSSRHEQNHYGRAKTIARVQAIAQKLVEATKILPRINDMSLPWGGIFDIHNNWVTPHNTHRTGRDIDIGFQGVKDGGCVDYDRDQLRLIVKNVTTQNPLEEPDHFHAFGDE